MKSLLGVIVLIAVVGGVMAALKAGVVPKRGPGSLPYKRRDWLLTEAERSFLAALDVAASPEQRVFAKVRLADLVWMPGKIEGRTGHQNRVNSKHVDFVVCEKKSLRPLAAIELDDASHASVKRRSRDEFVDAALCARRDSRSCGFRRCRMRGYAPAEIARRLAEALSPSRPDASLGAGPPARPL